MIWRFNLWLLVVVVVLKSATADTIMWPFCSVTPADFSAFDVLGNNFVSFGCEFPSYTTVTLSSAPTRNISVLISSGRVQGATSGLEVKGPIFNVNTRVPIHVTISDTNFVDSTILKFSGCLPPGSSLTFKDNTFLLSAGNFFGLPYDIAAIIIGSSGDDLALTSTKVTVTGNAGTLSSASKATSIVYIAVSTLIVANRSCFVVDDNSMTSGSIAQLAFSVVLWSSALQMSLEVTGFSSYSMDRNTISGGLIANGPARVIQWMAGGTMVIKLSSTSTLSISRNSLSTVLVGGFVCIIHLSPSTSLEVNIEDNSSFVMDGNILDSAVDVSSSFFAYGIFVQVSTGLSATVARNSTWAIRSNLMSNMIKRTQSYNVYISADFNATVIVTDSSTVNVSDNTMFLVHNSGTCNNFLLEASALTIELNRRSKWWTNGNTIRNSNVLNGFSADLAASGGNLAISLDACSQLQMSNNTIADSPVTGNLIVVYWYSYGSMIVSALGESSILLSGNTVMYSQSLASFSVYLATSEGDIEVSTRGSSIMMNENQIIGVQANYVKAVCWSPNGKIGLSISENSSFSTNYNAITKTSTVANDQQTCVLCTKGTLVFSITNGSSLSMSNNSAIDMMCIGPVFTIYLFTPVNELVQMSITNKSRLILSDNIIRNFTRMAINMYIVGNGNAYCVLLVGLGGLQLVMSDSLWAMERNSISASRLYSAYVVHLSAEGSFSWLIDNISVVLVSNNQAQSVQSSSEVNVVYIRQIASITGRNRSRLTISGNIVNDAEVGALTYGVRFESITNTISHYLVGSSTFIINDNIVMATTSPIISVVYWYYVGTLDLTVDTHCHMSYSGNHIEWFNASDRAVAVHLNIRQLLVTLRSGSELISDDNMLLNSKARTNFCLVIIWQAWGGQAKLTLTSSRLTYRNNRIEATISGMAKMISVLYFNASTNLYINLQNSTFHASDNGVNGVGAQQRNVVLLTSLGALALMVSNGSSAIFNNISAEGSTSGSASLLQWVASLDVTVSVTANSALSIDKCSVREVILSSDLYAILWLSTTGGVWLSIENGSVLDISNVDISDVILAASGTVTGVSLSSVARFNIRRNSSLLIKNTTIVNASAGTVRAIFIDTRSGLAISESSNVSIEGISISACTAGYFILVNVRALHGIVEINGKSNLCITSVNLNVEGLGMTTVAVLIGNDIASNAPLLLIQDYSTFVLQGSNIDLPTYLSTLGTLVQFALGVNAEASSSVFIYNNTAAVSDSTVIIINEKMTIDSSSMIALNKNSFWVTGSMPYCAPPVISVADGSVSGRLFIDANHVVISKLIANFAECPLLLFKSFQGSGAVSVSSNTIASTQPIYIQFGSLSQHVINISQNSLHCTWAASQSLLVVLSRIVLNGSASVLIHRNAFSSDSPMSVLDSLINATSATLIGSSNVVSVCENTIFGGDRSLSYPGDYVHPNVLAAIVVSCDFMTASQGVSNSFSMKPSKSQALIRTPSATFSSSPTTSSSQPSSSQSYTTILSDTISSEGSASTTASPSYSLSRTLTRSMSRPLTQSSTLQGSVSASTSTSCQPIGDLDVGDTCSVMRPLPVGWDGSAIDARSWLGTPNCTSITIPFDSWGGNQGGTHSVIIAAADPRVALNAMLRTPELSSSLIQVNAVMLLTPVTLLFADMSEAPNLTKYPMSSSLPRSGPANVTITYYTAVATVTYLGKTTLNKVQYRLGCSGWARCPIAMPGLMDVTLLASERLLPVAVGDAVNVGNGVVSIIGGLTVSPTAVAQLSVVTSLKQMSRCTSIALDEEGDASGYSSFSSGVANPLEIKLGYGGGGRRYIRASLVTYFVYLLLLSLLMFGFTTLSSRAVYYLTPSAPKPRPLLAGYPSALVAVISFVVDGVASAGTILLLQGSGWPDRVFGFLALTLCVLFVCQILGVTCAARFPSSLVALSTSQPEKELPLSLSTVLSEDLLSDDSKPELRDGGRQRSRLLDWLGKPTHKWHDSGNEGWWLARYESYIADANLPWYCGLEQVVALLVSVLSSLSLDSVGACVGRGTVCAVALLVQTLVMVLRQPLVHRWRWLLMSVVLVLQSLTALFSTANAPLQDQHIELGMDSIGVIIFFLLGVATAADMGLLLLELHEKGKVAFVVLKRRWRGRLSRRRHEQLSESAMTCIPTLEVPPTAIPDANEDSEEHIIRTILSQFRDYEEANQALVIDNNQSPLL